MTRVALFAGLLALAVTAGTAHAASSPPIMQDMYGQHPQILAPGTGEYDYIRSMKKQQSAEPRVDQQRLDTALRACADISPLSPDLKQKCQIKAHQQAELPANGPATQVPYSIQRHLQ